MAWIKELLVGEVDTLPYRVSGTLLLLYAQPLVRVAALRTKDVDITADEVWIKLGKQPAAVVPDPFAEMPTEHLRQRPNLRNSDTSLRNPWLFPGRNAGQHLDPQTMHLRLEGLGVDAVSARIAALRGLVSEMPPPVVADLLGYSYTCVNHHAEVTASPWSRYVTSTCDANSRRSSYLKRQQYDWSEY